MSPYQNNAKSAPVWHGGSLDEDALTAFTFRILSLIPEVRDTFFTRLEEENSLRSGSFAGGGEVKFESWPTFIVPRELQTAIYELRKLDKHKEDKPKKKYSENPDAAIYKENEWYILVESEFGHPYERGQVIGQLVALNYGANEPKQKYQEPYYLLINNEPGARKEELKREINGLLESKRVLLGDKVYRRIKSIVDDSFPRLLWFNWDKFIGIFEDILTTYENLIRRPDNQDRKYLFNVRAGLLREGVEVFRRKGIIYLEPLKMFLDNFMSKSTSCKRLYLASSEKVFRTASERRMEIAALQFIIGERLTESMQKVHDNHNDISELMSLLQIPEVNDGA